MKKVEINLDDIINKNTKVLAGRDLGKQTRLLLNLDQKDFDEQEYIINFPSRIYSCSASYFLSLFGKSVRTLDHNFLEKYHFVCKKIIKKDIISLIDVAKNVKNINEFF